MSACFLLVSRKEPSTFPGSIFISWLVEATLKREWERYISRCESLSSRASDSNSIVSDFNSIASDYNSISNSLHEDVAGIPTILTSEALPRIRTRSSETFRAQYIYAKEIRICAATWNVGGRVPPDDLDFDGWLDIDNPADVYVIGLQEIIPLSAGNLFGAEDSRPVSKWENIIREALNQVPPVTKFQNYSNPPSPSRFKPSKSFSTASSSKSDSNPPSASSFESITSPENQMRSEIDLLAEIDLESLINRKRKAPYVRIISKQMVGIFITIWVRRSLRKHVQNLKVSTVGVGVMGYIGNKGSVSVSLSLHQTLFCFVCAHLRSGEKDGDAVKRNADVHEIHRRTRFNSLSGLGLPRTILDHERIIWLGDLNYRINLSYELTRELISKRDWSRLREQDELIKELKKGRAFDGWSEGSLSFAPTYKYDFNSDSYIGEDSKAGRRTPAWCDRILSFGKGMKLLSYRRSEVKFSHHRPVTASYLVEVEVFSPRKLQRALTFTDAEFEEEDLVMDV